MKKIVQYDIITNDHYDFDESVKRFPKEVQEYIDEGWSVYGKLLKLDDGILCQAVVKYEDNDICTRPD